MYIYTYMFTYRMLYFMYSISLVYTCVAPSPAWWWLMAPAVTCLQMRHLRGGAAPCCRFTCVVLRSCLDVTCVVAPLLCITCVVMSCMFLVAPAWCRFAASPARWRLRLYSLHLRGVAKLHGCHLRGVTVASASPAWCCTLDGRCLKAAA